MTRDTDPFSAHVAEILRRTPIIPFTDGRYRSGLFVAEWESDMEDRTHVPSRLRGGVVYHVTDGVPGAARISDIPCDDAWGLDVPGLMATHGTPFEAPGGTRMAENASCIGDDGDPFVGLSWQSPPSPYPVLGCSLRAALYTKALSQGRGAMDEAEARARALHQDRLSRAAHTHFVGHISPRHRAIADWMAARLPSFTWGAFRTLTEDPEGRAMAFARAYPAVAGRSLRSDSVLECVRSGRFEDAFGLSVDADLVGCWVADAIGRHPPLAAVPDGRVRGFDADFAFDMLRKLPARRMPRDAEGFRVAAEVCAMAGAASLWTPGCRKLVADVAGNWERALRMARQAAEALPGGHPAQGVAPAYQGMIGSFRHDLLERALVIEDHPLRNREVHEHAEDLVCRGAGLADRIRLAARYMAAKPTVAGVQERFHRKIPMWWAGAEVEDAPWISAPGHPYVVRPVFVGSKHRAESRIQGIGQGAEVASYKVILDAPTPDGDMAVQCEVRHVESGPLDQAKVLDLWLLSGWEGHVAEGLARAWGLQPGEGLGAGILARFGLLNEAEAALKGSRETRMANLEAMQAAWSRALPRRWRGLPSDEFRRALASEYAALTSASVSA